MAPGLWVAALAAARVVQIQDASWAPSVPVQVRAVPARPRVPGVLAQEPLDPGPEGEHAAPAPAPAGFERGSATEVSALEAARARSVDASPAALRALRDLSLVADRLAEMQDLVRPGAESALALTNETVSTVVEGTANLSVALASLSDSAALLRRGVEAGPANKAASRNDLYDEMSSLQDQLQRQRDLLGAVEPDETPETRAERMRAAFDQIDINGDGELQWEEFKKYGLSVAGQDPTYTAELRRQFELGDVDESTTLSYSEFEGIIKRVRGDVLGPLRAAYTAGNERLLGLSLQLVAQTLAAELAGAPRGGRGKRLSIFVDRWCELEERAGEAPDRAECYEALLTEVSGLAGELSLPATNPDGVLYARRIGRTLSNGARNARNALSFCGRGLVILGRDLLEVGRLAKRRARGEALKPEDRQAVRRTVVDMLALVPYTIIMIIPLSPPGHVFAFSLMQKCFPAAVPSPFTSQRQDLYDIYSRIASSSRAAAAPAQDASVLLPQDELYLPSDKPGQSRFRPAAGRVRRLARRAREAAGGALRAYR